MIRALLGIGLLQLVSMLLLMARTKVLAITVGAQGVGTIANLDALAAVIAQTLSMSLPFAALRFLPATLRESASETDLLYRRMRFLVLLLIIPATVVCIITALVAPQVFGSALVPYRRTMLLALAGLPVIGLMPFLTNAYAGSVGHMQSMRLTIAHAAVMVVAAIAAGAGLGVDGFYAVYALLGGVLVIVASRRLAVPGFEGPRAHLSFRDAFRLPPAMWRFAAWLLPLTFLAPYASLFVKYTTLRLYGANTAGVLQGAIGISLSVRALLGAAYAVFLTPNVNRQADVGARMRWADEFQRTSAVLFAITLPPLLLFSDIALRLLYAPAFLAGSAFVALFVASEVLTMLSGTYQALIIADNRMRFHVLQNLAAQALLVATAAIALPSIGLAGAGLASLSAPVFLFATTLVFLNREHGVRLSAGAARASVLVILILIVAGVIGSKLPGLTPSVLALKAGVCVVLWIGALAAVPSEDRARLMAGVERVLSRRKTVAPVPDEVS